MRGPSSEGPSALWTDDDFERVRPMLKVDFHKPYEWVSDRKTVVFPKDECESIRTFLSNAQTIYVYIAKKIELLELICMEMGKDDAADTDKPPMP